MAKLLKPRDFYTPRRIESAAETSESYTALRKEYSRLRKIWYKRMRNIEKTRGQALDLTKTEIYRNMAKYPAPKLEDIKSKTQFSYELSKLVRVLSDGGRGTAAGMSRRAKKAVKTLKRHGYEHISVKNVVEFGRFMEKYRAEKLDHVVGSPDAADLYNVLIKKKINPDDVWGNFEKWADSTRKLEKLKPERHPGQKNSKYYAGILGITDKESGSSGGQTETAGKQYRSTKRGKRGRTGRRSRRGRR